MRGRFSNELRRPLEGVILGLSLRIGLNFDLHLDRDYELPHGVPPYVLGATISTDFLAPVDVLRQPRRAAAASAWIFS